MTTETYYGIFYRDDENYVSSAILPKKYETREAAELALNTFIQEDLRGKNPKLLYGIKMVS